MQTAAPAYYQTATLIKPVYSEKNRHMKKGANYSYFGARYYDSDLSVWLSVDPMSDDYPSTSPYMYVLGNPLNLVDPFGMNAWLPPTDGSNEWTAEPGDCAWTLAEDAGISFDEAKDAVGSMNASRGKGEGSLDVYVGDKVAVGDKPESKSSTNSSNYYTPPLATGSCESVSVVGTLIDVFVREPIQEGLEYLGMGEDAAYWTSTGITIVGSIVLAKKLSGGKTVKNTVPEGNYANHLFKGAGKLPDNPASRALIQKTSNGKPLGVDPYGKSWYTGVDAAGKSIYTYTQNGVVKGAGYMNMTPAEMITKYGLK